MSAGDPREDLPGFDLEPRTRIVFGAGCRRRAGELARGLGARRALLVTDPGVLASGHAGAVERALREAGLEVARFAEVRENPTTLDVERCLAAARAATPDVLVAVGGGSSIDVAKGADFLLTNGGSMRDYVGRATARRPLLPLIAVPTTAGTGSEVQSFALIADEGSHAKMACGDPSAAPRVALLDPETTLTLPPFVTACTGLDAIGHAVEAAVTRAATPASDLFARESFRLAARALPAVLRRPDDLAARGEMLLAAAWAGLAIEGSMLGAAHSMANPLTAHFDVAHGQAVATSLPHVVRFNAEDPRTAERYAALARAAGLADRGEPARAAALRLAESLSDLLAQAGLPGRLADLGVDAAALPRLAAEAAGQWTARFNPRPVGEADFRALYAAARGA